MIPTRIKLENFLSYRTADVPLGEAGIIALEGDNGAGKSALAVDALTWALWGESRARSDDDLVRQGADECQVEITFEAGGGLYRAVRRRRRPSEGKRGASVLSFVRLDGVGGETNIGGATIKETQDLIDGVLGFDLRTFLNTSCLIQGRSDEFMRADPKDRKRVLASLLDLDEWERWSGIARGERRKAEADRDAASAAVASTETLIAEKEPLLALKVAAEATADSAAEPRGKAHDKLVEARVGDTVRREKTAETDLLAQQLQAQALAIDKKKAEVDDLNRRVSALPQGQQIEKLRTDIDQAQEKADRFDVIVQMRRQYGETKRRIEDQRQQIDRDLKAAEMLDGDVRVMKTRLDTLLACPTCERELSGASLDAAKGNLGLDVEKVEMKIATINEEIAQRQRELTDQENERSKLSHPSVADLDEAHDARASLPLLREEMGRLQGAAESADTLRELLGAGRAELAQAEENHQKAKKALADARELVEIMGDTAAYLKGCQAEYDTADVDWQKANEECIRLSGRLEQIEEAERLLGSQRQRFTLAADRAELMATLERAFGPDGIQSLLIEAAIPDIVTEANRLLAGMSSATTIDLRTTRAGKSTSRDIDTLDVIIADRQGIRPYELYSGGERFRIDFSLRLGMSRVLSGRVKSPCRTLIIDEGFGSQDGRSKTALLEGLATVRSHFGLILVISHLEDLRETMPSRISVSKGPDGSEAILSLGGIARTGGMPELPRTLEPVASGGLDGV